MGISFATGELFLETMDIGLFGVVPVAMSRHYNSRFLELPAGSLGRGWRHGLDYQLRQTVDGYTYSTPDGAEYAFVDGGTQLLQTGRLVNRSGRLQLTTLADGELLVQSYGDDLNPVALRYRRFQNSAHFVLSRAQNASGRGVEFRHDDSGLLTEAYQQRERRLLRFEHDENGVLHRAMACDENGSPLGVAIRYHYAGDQLVRVDDHDGPLLRYAYDDQGRLLSELKRSGSVTYYDYQADGRCSHASGSEGLNERWLDYDTAGRVTEMRDSHGEIWRYEYNVAGQITYVRSPTASENTLRYDDDGLIVMEQLGDDFVIEYDYDDYGRLTRVLYPTGLQQQYAYDDEHRLVRYTDWRGLHVDIEHDVLGLVAAITMADGRRHEMTYNGFGQLINERDALGNAVQFFYDDYGRIHSREDAKGYSWRFEYDPLGLQTKRIDPLGNQLEVTYDSQQRVSMRRFADGTEIHHSYGSTGNEQVEVRSDGRRRSIRYSACGQPLEVSDLAGRVTRFEWDTEQWRMLAIITPGGRRHTFTHDAEGNLIEHCYPDGTTRRFEWTGRQLSATIDRAGKRIEREYDVLGYLRQLTGEDGTVTYDYDEEHCLPNLLQTFDSQGKLTSAIAYEYDAFGKLNGIQQGNVSLRQQLFASGSLAQMETSLGDTMQFSYDARGQCVSSVWNPTAVPPADPDQGAGADFRTQAWPGARVAFSHDALGRERERTLGSAGTLRQAYDAVGRLVQQSFHRSSAVSTAPESSTPSFRRQYTYAETGLLSSIEDSLRGWKQFLHGPDYRLMGANAPVLPTEYYGYDADGNRLWDGSLFEGQELLRQGQELGPTTQGWHSLTQVIREQGGEVQTYEYDSAGRLAKARRGPKTLSYRYDSNGQLIEKQVEQDGQTNRWMFSWNSFGRLTALDTPDGETWLYSYDAIGRRVQKQGPQWTIDYVWDQNALLYELRRPTGLDSLKGESEEHSAETTEVTFYGRHPLNGELLFVRHGSELRYVVPDHVGSPSELVDNNGELTRFLTRHTWGGREAGEGLAAGFSNQWLDSESGLLYNLFRYYDPDIGRFISPDPTDLRGGLNLYSYVPSPAIFNDPLGEIARRPDGSIIVPSDRADTSGRTQINDPDRGTPYMGGHDRVYDTPQQRAADTDRTGGERIDLGGATVTDVGDGDRGVVAHVYNGAPEGDLSTPRSRNVDHGASRTTWWHSEQSAMTAVLRGDIPLSGSGDITFDISRPPCSRTRGHGCTRAVLDGIDGSPSLAQRVANETGRRVVVTYPDPSEDNPQRRRTRTFSPDC